MESHKSKVMRTLALVMALSAVSSAAVSAQDEQENVSSITQTISSDEEILMRRGFAIQPQDVVCSPASGHGYLEYAFKSMPYRMELLADGKVFLEWENENVPANRISVFDEVDGKEMMIRIYYVPLKEGGVPDVYESVPFHIYKGNADDFKILAQPVDPVLTNGKGLATCGVSFKPVQALLYANGEFLRELTVLDDIVNAEVTSADVGKQLTFRVFYSDERADFVESEPFFVRSEEDMIFSVQPLSAVLSGDTQEAFVTFCPAFEPVKLEKICDGKVTYSTDQFYRDGNSGLITFAYGADDADKKQVIRAYYGTGKNEYVDSDEFVIVSADKNHHFTKQPQDMEVSVNGDKPLSWKVDFSPIKQVAVRDGKELATFDDDAEEFDAYDWYMMPSGRYRIRSYYGRGTTDYVESDIFTHIRPAFTVSPRGGYCTTRGSREVSWQLNFKPAKVELWAEGAYLRDLPNDKSSHTFSASGLGGYQIVAYFDDSDRSAIYSPFFNVTGTELPFHEIVCDNEVAVYNSQNQLTSCGVEGEQMTAIFEGDSTAFEDFKADGVEFVPQAAPDMPGRQFIMPAHDVDIRVVYHTEPNDGPGGEHYQQGDVDGDGKINVTDIALVASHIKGIKALDEKAQMRADVDRSGKINVTDIALIASHIKGIKPIE